MSQQTTLEVLREYRLANEKATSFEEQCQNTKTALAKVRENIARYEQGLSANI